MKKIIYSILIIIGLASCQKEQITVSTDAKDTFFLQEKGNSMPIHVRGNTASKTFLLMVHGGPGSGSIIYMDDVIKNTIESDFAVAYWDQRYAWAAQGSTELAEPTFEDVVSDLEKVLLLLKKRYGNDIAIFLNGHSWGGFLAPYYLVKGDNQKNIKGWIQTDGAHDIPLLNKLTIEMLLKRATTEIAVNRNTAKWTEIKDFVNTITLPATVEQTLRLNDYAQEANKSNLTPEIQELSQNELLKNYANNKGAAIAFLASEAFFKGRYNDKMFQKLSLGSDLPSKLPLIKVPTLILYGKWDHVTPLELGDDVAAKIKSTYIKKIIYPNAAHLPMFSSDKVKYWSDVKEFMNKFK